MKAMNYASHKYICTIAEGYEKLMQDVDSLNLLEEIERQLDVFFYEYTDQKPSMNIGAFIRFVIEFELNGPLITHHMLVHLFYFVSNIERID